jgi:hypothetical protein
MHSSKRTSRALVTAIASVALATWFLVSCGGVHDAPERVATTSSALAARGSNWDKVFSDGNGWNVLAYANTIRLGDLDGDGRADVCGRGITDVYCELSSGGSFEPVSAWDSQWWMGQRFSDANGWSSLVYADTMQLADVTGDRKADVCIRGAAGVYCAESIGWNFSNPWRWSMPADFTDAGGWANLTYAPTFRLADIDGDGKADLCARGANGVYCGISTGASFGTATLWSRWLADATLQLGDIDGDGMADMCARNWDGVRCARSNGAGFGSMDLWDLTGYFGDAGSWNLPQYANTIRLADVNGDHRADICGRGSGGIYCAASTGSSFTPWLNDTYLWPSLFDTTFSDANQWASDPSYYDTIMFGDVDGSGLSSVCGRGISGIWCALTATQPVTNPGRTVKNNLWGSMLTNVRVHTIFWNGDVPFQDDLAQAATAFVGDTEYGEILGRYATDHDGWNSYRPTLGVSGVVSNGATDHDSVFIGGQAILNVIRHAWDLGVPKPGNGYDELYLVYLPPYKQIGDHLTCDNCTGIHAGLYFPELVQWSAGALVQTSNLQGVQLSDAPTEVASHEFAEAVTDPYAFTYYSIDTSHEIGDLCEGQSFHTIVGGYVMSKLWDQFNGSALYSCQPGR